jgi:hypothetical protein
MLEGQGKKPQRRVLPYVLVLLACGFVFTASISRAFAAGPETDFIAMYKGFFQDLQDKKYKKVWDAMTEASKKQIAQAITDAFIEQKKEATQDGVYGMLEKDTSNIRTMYFDNLNAELEKLSFFSEIKEAEYSIKSSTEDLVILTITITKEPKDFDIIREDGKWKINFIADLFH